MIIRIISGNIHLFHCFYLLMVFIRQGCNERYYKVVFFLPSNFQLRVQLTFINVSNSLTSAFGHDKC